MSLESSPVRHKTLLMQNTPMTFIVEASQEPAEPDTVEDATQGKTASRALALSKPDLT